MRSRQQIMEQIRKSRGEHEEQVREANKVHPKTLREQALEALRDSRGENIDPKVKKKQSYDEAEKNFDKEFPDVIRHPALAHRVGEKVIARKIEIAESGEVVDWRSEFHAIANDTLKEHGYPTREELRRVEGLKEMREARGLSND